MFAKANSECVLRSECVLSAKARSEYVLRSACVLRLRMNVC